MADVSRDRSYWNATAPAPDFPELVGDIKVEVAIVGGGIVGITTARMLKDRGVTVAVIEGRKVGRQVTGKSTAKVTSQHSVIYQTLEQKFGEDRARLYADAQQAGVAKIRSLASQYGIECDLEEKPAYVYTRDEKKSETIEKEVDIARRLGLPAQLVRETGLPFEVRCAMRFDDQAQFHPTKYVAGLAQTIPGDGSYVYEHSRAMDWEPTRVVTRRGTVRARHVVMATHLPLGQIGGYYTEAHPYAEPVLAAKIKSALPGMYISMEDPSHSIRTHTGKDGQVYAISGGASFKPGHIEQERESSAEMERWLTENFGVGAIEYRWINEDYSPIDNAPFVGWSSSKGDRYLVATGFKAWGISNGTAAAMMLADLATEKTNPWLELFDASRVKPVAGGATFVQENLGVAKDLVGGYLASKAKSFDELKPGDAAILKINGENVAGFKDEHGKVHAVSAVCSHMGCLVGWNETDRTWDCPCHGSRFELDGEVIHGPATKPLGSKVIG
jgi:glycine/D-amino acid oxidase-like deaminating enzyme/nitrite reductase/ring-hydroxylating ferredoxin subunit